MRPQSEWVCVCPCASALTHESEKWEEMSVTFDHNNGLEMASLLNNHALPYTLALEGETRASIIV